MKGGENLPCGTGILIYDCAGVMGPNGACHKSCPETVVEAGDISEGEGVNECRGVDGNLWGIGKIYRKFKDNGGRSAAATGCRAGAVR